MREIFLNKINLKLDDKEEVLVEAFCEDKIDLIKKEMSKNIFEQYIKNSNIKIKELEHSTVESPIYAALLVKTDEVSISLNSLKIKEKCVNSQLDYDLVIEKLVAHELLHYYTITNKIELVYRRKKMIGKKINLTEELIINDLVDYYIESDISIYQIYG